MHYRRLFGSRLHLVLVIYDTKVPVHFLTLLSVVASGKVWRGSQRWEKGVWAAFAARRTGAIS
jgi:hypothetical protein